MLRSLLVVVVLACVAIGCAVDSAVTVDLDPGAPPTGGKADGSTTPGLRTCTTTPFVAPTPIGFRSPANRLISLLEPHHRAQDVIATPNTTVDVVGGFGYGPTNKSLELELVSAYIDTCGSWVELGEHTTDDTGTARWSLDGALPAGQYRVRYFVHGDGTQAIGDLWILPVGTHVALTDIDGTLTMSDAELLKQLTDASYVPVAYPAAAELTRAHAERNYVMVYLTGRPTALLDTTRHWLGTGGFASGPVHVAETAGDALPTEAGVGDFKAAWLKGLADQGLVIDLAYGNATTDIYGYAKAGIPADRTWIIGPHAGTGETHAVMTSWAERAAAVAALPTVTQPF